MTAAPTTHDPSRQGYAPYYDEPGEEYDRLVRCLQQQIEDCFTTMTRIQANEAAPSAWRDLGGGLRVWRAATRTMGKRQP